MASPLNGAILNGVLLNEVSLNYVILNGACPNPETEHTHRVSAACGFIMIYSTGTLSPPLPPTPAENFVSGSYDHVMDLGFLTSLVNNCTYRVRFLTFVPVSYFVISLSLLVHTFRSCLVRLEQARIWPTSPRTGQDLV